MNTADHFAGIRGSPDFRLEEDVSSRGTSQPGGRAALGVLVFLCMVGFMFGVGKILHDVRAPFNLQPDTSFEHAQALLNSGLEPNAEDEVLKRTDTDGDGISNYDETNLYHTSPYIKDSDSDNISDPDEIAKGGDPLCPEGHECVNTESRAIVDAAAPASDTMLKNPDVPVAIVSPSDAGTAAKTGTVTAATDASIAAKLQKDPNSLTPAEIRQLLLASGQINATQLQGLDDTKLKALFLKAYTQTSGSTTVPTSKP